MYFLFALSPCESNSIRKNSFFPPRIIAVLCFFICFFPYMLTRLVFLNVHYAKAATEPMS